MSKTITLGTLILCATAFVQASCALEKATIVRDLDISTSNSSTVPFNGHLYTVSKNQSHIHVNSSDSNYQPCDIAINAERDLTHGILEVTPTEDEIFIVGVKSIDENEKYKYTILRVDPTACSYESADLPETNDDRGDYFLPRLVRHHTGTDVFFPSLRNCAPCRFNDGGLRARTSTPQIPQEEKPLYIRFHVRYASSNSYFYVFNSWDYPPFRIEATMKILDSDDFSTKKERTVDDAVYAISKQEKTIEHLGVCFKTFSRNVQDTNAISEIHCDKLNSNLETINTVRIPIEPDSERISTISYEFDKEGNSYISYSQSSDLRLYIHDSNGKLVKAMDLGEVDKRFHYYPDFNPESFDAYEYWNVRGFLVGDEYCIVAEQVAKTYLTPLHQVKCINIKKYVKN